LEGRKEVCKEVRMFGSNEVWKEVRKFGRRFGRKEGRHFNRYITVVRIGGKKLRKVGIKEGIFDGHITVIRIRVNAQKSQKSFNSFMHLIYFVVTYGLTCFCDLKNRMPL